MLEILHGRIVSFVISHHAERQRPSRVRNLKSI